MKVTGTPNTIPLQSSKVDRATQAKPGSVKSADGEAAAINPKPARDGFALGTTGAESAKISSSIVETARSESARGPKLNERQKAGSRSASMKTRLLASALSVGTIVASNSKRVNGRLLADLGNLPRGFGPAAVGVAALYFSSLAVSGYVAIKDAVATRDKFKDPSASRKSKAASVLTTISSAIGAVPLAGSTIGLIAKSLGPQYPAAIVRDKF